MHRFIGLILMTLALLGFALTNSRCAGLQHAETSFVKAGDTFSAAATLLSVTDELAASWLDGITDPTEQQFNDAAAVIDLIHDSCRSFQLARDALVDQLLVRDALEHIEAGLDYMLDALQILMDNGADVSEPMKLLRRVNDLLTDAFDYCNRYGDRCGGTF